MKRQLFKPIWAIAPLMLLLLATAGGVSAAIRDRLNISASESSEYARLIFHRNVESDFTPKLDGNQLRVSFDTPFWSNFAEIQKKLSDYILTSDITQDGKTLIFTLRNPEQIRLRPFIGEAFVGVDLVQTQPSPEKPKTQQFAGGQLIYEEAAIQQDVVKESFQLAQQDIQEIELDNVLSASEQSEPAPFVTVPENTEIVQQTPLAETPELIAEPTSSASEQPTIADEPVTDSEASNQEPQSAIPANEEAAPEETIANSGETPNAPQSTLQPDASLEDTTEQPIAATEPTTASENTPNEQVAATATKTPEAPYTPPAYSEVVFRWEKPVAATIFRRGNYAWFIFNTAKDINISDLITKHSDLFAEGEQIENRQHTILRLKLRHPFSLSSSKKDQDWHVALTTRRNPPTQPFPVTSNSSNLHGSSLEIQSAQFAEPLRITDPFVGDQLVIIPSYEAEAGIGSARKQTDFVLLQSAQGIAIQIKSDDVQIEQKRFGLALSGPTNRITSAESQALRERLEELKRKREEARQAKLAQEGEQALLKFHSWKGEKPFTEERQQLEEKITLANWENKNPFRLDLARFYLANSMEVEALGVIATISAFDPVYGNRADVLLVEGAANYLAGRYKEASETLEKINKDEMDDIKKAEVKFWQAAAELRMGSSIEMDRFVTRHPLKDEEKQSEQSEDKVEITKLILDTSSRLLKMIKKIDPQLATSEEIQTLESTARFVSSHYQDAIKRFGESEMYRSGDAFEAEDETLWWNTSGIRSQSQKYDYEYLENRLLFLKDYPTPIYNDFALLALEERLENNDITTAERVLETFRESEDAHFQNDLTYLRGLFYAKDEEIDLALETWEPLTNDVFDRQNRARSTFAMTGILLRTGRINLDEAIDTFNGLRMVWRGDVLELNLLKLLGEFYMDRKQYMNAFKTWREVLTNFPGSEDALLIAKKMNQEFVYLFNSGGANELSQLEALTLYYEFRELTPVGKQGDQMILKLVDRLVEVDLLDRASALLTHLVRFRLTGEEKHLASTRLAEIYLMANQYDRALDALNATKSDRIDNELSTRRRYIQTKALINLKQNNQALALLRGDETVEASFLRAEIYWRNKVWRKVVDELEYPFKEIIREERDLTKAEREALNKIAISYALMGNRKRLRLLQEDFTPYVPEAQKQLLAFISNDDTILDYRNLEASLGLEKMENFIQTYMNMADGGNNSATNNQ